MKIVADIIAAKGAGVISVLPSTTVLDALQLMANRNIGSVAVVEENGNYHGLLTERDYARKVILLGRHSYETIVDEIKSDDLPKVSLSTTLEECMLLMTAKNIRYLPVFKEDQLYGIVSVNDVIKAVIDNQANTISQLQQYIHS